MNDQPNIQVDLRGKVALVTGASQGLGRHFALVLAKAGAMVVATSLKSERAKLDDLVLEINKTGKAIALDIDLREIDQFSEKVKLIVNQTNKIDILINNAGVSYYSKFFDI